MIDWTKSMQQTFDFYTVDPGTWRNVRPVTTVISGTVTYDLGNELIATASFETEEDLGECYLRPVLKCIQNGTTYEFPLGTFLTQSPESSFDGRLHKRRVDAYSPLIELKDKKPPFGYAALKDDPIMDLAYQLTDDNVRCPVVASFGDTKTLNDNFVSDFENDTWFSFVSDLLSNAKYHFELDELCRIMFAPDQKTASLRPVWTFDDGNSSILYPEITANRDLYGIPNVVEVLCSSGAGYKFYRAENRRPNSPVSIVNRGREIVHRVNNPSGLVSPDDDEIKDFAENLLETLSSSECTLNYKHGYCGTKVGQAVRLNYERAGIKNVVAKVISQSIELRPGATVTEKAVYTTKVWG